MLPLSHLYLCLLLVSHSSPFSILSADPSEVLVRPGDLVRLLCIAGSHYELCKFFHPSQAFCDFEWKRLANNITTQQCPLAPRVSMVCSIA